MSNTCANCKFHHRTDHEGLGKCQRFPPISLYQGSAQTVAFVQPTMLPDDYCAEHQLKEPSKEEKEYDEPEFVKQMAALKRQSNEFSACHSLVQAYNQLPPVVDDDYPRYRHYYEQKLRQFVKELYNNRGVDYFLETIPELRHHR